MPKIPHTEGLDEVIDDILDDFESHFTILTGADAEQGHWKAKSQIKALLAETKKPPHKTKELSRTRHHSTEVDTSIVPNIDEALDKHLSDMRYELSLGESLPPEEYDKLELRLHYVYKTILKELIESTIQSVLGEDEHNKSVDTTYQEWRNELRFEQRSKLGRLMKGEK